MRNASYHSLYFRQHCGFANFPPAGSGLSVLTLTAGHPYKYNHSYITNSLEKYTPVLAAALNVLDYCKTADV